jgi:uncharacterized membrane protein
MHFNASEEQRVVAAIQAAEQATTGEIRVFMEDICDADHPVERAVEVFALHGMHNTTDRNAVLIYVARESRQFAIWGDAGIHEKVGEDFWEAEKRLLRSHLQRDEACDGLCAVIAEVGAQLNRHYPAPPGFDNKNELPDDIIYG